MRLIATWRRRLGLAFSVLLVVMIVAAALMFSIETAYRSWSSSQLITRIFTLPALLATAVFFLTSAAAAPAAAQALHKPAIEAEPVTSSQPFVAQVVGLEWLNPLQRRDYPTEWQLLWTLGLVKPNPNDDMVRAKPVKYSSVQPVAIVADGVRGTETFKGFQEKYVDELLQLFGDRYVLSPHYFYTVASSNKREWHELAGIHVEYAIPAGRLDPVQAGGYLRDEIASVFNIGNTHFKDLWTKSTPPDVHVTPGGPNAGFTSLNKALDYLRSHPKESVWVMNWDAPSFPPKDEQMNENMVLLILAGPQMETGRDPLAWISQAATADVSTFESKPGTARAIQAWKSAIDTASTNAGIKSTDIAYVIHEAGRGGDAASERIAALGRSLTETLPEFDFNKQTFNTPALLGEMGAGTALTDVVLAIGRANHLGGHVLVAGTTDPAHLTAVVVTPPAQLIPIDPERPWFRARGENNAYLPWWGRRRGVSYPTQGFTE